jgi:hypothetical protein
MTADSAIALTRRRFEASPPQHAHAAIPTGDQPGLLERAQHNRHRRAVDPEHDGQEFLLQWKIIPVDAVVRVQQPSTAALPDIVPGVAGGSEKPECQAYHALSAAWP